MNIHLDPQTLLILVLIASLVILLAFLLGLIAGVRMMRPQSYSGGVVPHNR